MIIDFLKKVIKSIKSMITEDNIAAAKLAQIFGSELLHVQHSISDAKSQPDIVKLNPKQFLVGHQNFDRQRKAEEQELLARINREAEMLHPLPQQPQPQEIPQVHSIPQRVPQQVPQHVAAEKVFPSTPSFVQSAGSQHTDVLLLIANFLERIAIKLESVDIKPKRKTIKRKPKNSKKVLLHENNV